MQHFWNSEVGFKLRGYMPNVRLVRSYEYPPPTYTKAFWKVICKYTYYLQALLLQAS